MTPVQSSESDVGRRAERASVIWAQAQHREPIWRTLARPVSGGIFSETVTVEGVTRIHSVSLATGWGWSVVGRAYREECGALPPWVALAHPAHRRSLCELAMQLGACLPNVAPLPGRA